MTTSQAVLLLAIGAVLLAAGLGAAFLGVLLGIDEPREAAPFWWAAMALVPAGGFALVLAGAWGVERLIRRLRKR